jgi:hypothetical protein
MSHHHPKGLELMTLPGAVAPQDSVAGAAHDGGVSTPEFDSTVDTTVIGSTLTRTESTVGVSSSQMQMGATATWPDDDDDEFEVVMGRPCFHGPKLISLPEALDTAHAALSQVWHVLRWEWVDLGVEKQCLKELSSLLKAWTKSEQ